MVSVLWPLNAFFYLKRFGAPVTTNAAAILHQPPAVAAANDILCVSILVLRSLVSSSSSSGLNGGFVMCCHQRRRRKQRQAAPPHPSLVFLAHSLSPRGMFDETSVCVRVSGRQHILNHGCRMRFAYVWKEQHILGQRMRAFCGDCIFMSVRGYGVCVYTCCQAGVLSEAHRASQNPPLQLSTIASYSYLPPHIIFHSQSSP